MISLMPKDEHIAYVPEANDPVPEADDPVVQLREWGTQRCRSLPDAPWGDYLIGTSAECAFRLNDPRSAPKQARVTRESGRWWIRDLGGKGLRQDGIPRQEFVLTPGVEIDIGGTVVVAESVRSVALREFCQRFLGWGVDRWGAVDRALRAIRLAIARRSSLVLLGQGDLVPVAHALHRHMLGDSAPFVVCDRRRMDAPATVRSPANLGRGVEAFTAAIRGSLCVRSLRLPYDFDQVVPLLHEAASEVLLIVCVEGESSRQLLASGLPIQLPPLTLRESEVPRIIEEYALDAVESLRAPEGCFTDSDRQWVSKHSARSISEIEKGTLRILALKTSSNVNEAAARLGMAPISLARWLARRAALPRTSYGTVKLAARSRSPQRPKP
jgi:hypothetical protein